MPSITRMSPARAVRALVSGPRAMLVAVALLGAASAADAALKTGACLAEKRAAWTSLRKCQGTEHGKELKGKPTDLAKCQTKFQEKLAKTTAKATKAAIACRYGDNGDGTVTDFDTGLMWEQKTGEPGVTCIEPAFHCVSTTYDFDAATDLFVNQLLNGSSTDGATIPDRFAGYSDWRLPTIVELRTILLEPGPCSTSPCIDPIFGPTVALAYWSATTVATAPGVAWFVGFNAGNVGHAGKNFNVSVRAVRGGL